MPEARTRMAGRNKKNPRKESKTEVSDSDENDQGVISFAEGDEMCIDFAVECENCGTMIEYLTERCPICGRRFDIADTGIASLYSDMEFDSDHAAEIDCPVCGEKVKPSRGKCPACKESIGFTKADDPGAKVDPIVRDENVVFVHLDVESGEVNCLQRVENSSGFERLSVRLETIGQGEFERGRKSVSRV